MTIYISNRMAEMKKCCRCHKNKTNDEFKEGNKTCIACLANMADYQKKNPEKMRANTKRHYDKDKDKIIQRQQEKNKVKVWCDCCRTEVRSDGWQDHLTTYKHKHYKELEEGDVVRQEGKVWCETCRVPISKKSFTKHKKSKEHLRRLNL